MYLGRYQQGAWLNVPLLDSAWPTDASGDRTYPEMRIFDSNWDLVSDGEQVKPIESTTGLHRIERRLGPELPVGQYTAVIRWKVASGTVNRDILRRFTVVAGGHAAGAYIGLHYLSGNNTDAIAGMLDGGTIEIRRGPQ